MKNNKIIKNILITAVILICFNIKSETVLDAATSNVTANDSTASKFKSISGGSDTVKTSGTGSTATTKSSSGSSGISAPVGNSTDLKTIFTNVLNMVQTIMIMLSSLYIIYAGFMFVTAKGNPEKLKKAKDSLFWGLMGAGLVLTAEVLAYGISDTVQEVFKGK